MADAGPGVSIADEVWIAAALLHREHPERDGFTARQRAGVATHASQHCVANRPSSPARLRLLFAISRSQCRLFRPGDAFHHGQAKSPRGSAEVTSWSPRARMRAPGAATFPARPAAV